MNLNFDNVYSDLGTAESLLTLPGAHCCQLIQSELPAYGTGIISSFIELHYYYFFLRIASKRAGDVAEFTLYVSLRLPLGING